MPEILGLVKSRCTPGFNWIECNLASIASEIIFEEMTRKGPYIMQIVVLSLSNLIFLPRLSLKIRMIFVFSFRHTIFGNNYFFFGGGIGNMPRIITASLCLIIIIIIIINEQIYVAYSPKTSRTRSKQERN